MTRKDAKEFWEWLEKAALFQGGGDGKAGVEVLKGKYALPNVMAEALVRRLERKRGVKA